MKNETIKQYTTTVTELDPCKAPEGCPELEPWMAYVGNRELTEAESQAVFYTTTVSGEEWSRHYGPFGEFDRAVDVRHATAQEHFPEHCRIRNYQEPDPLNDLLQEICVERHNTDGYCFSKDEMREAYELGQQNPTK
jgi:hypothetical protein